MRFKWLLISGLFAVGLLLLPFSYASYNQSGNYSATDIGVGLDLAATVHNATGPDTVIGRIWQNMLRQIDGVLSFAAQAIDAVSDAPGELFDVLSNNPPDSPDDIAGIDPSLITRQSGLPAPQAYDGTLIFNLPLVSNSDLTVGGQTNLIDLFVSGEFSITDLDVPGVGTIGSIVGGAAQLGSLNVSGNTQLNTLSVAGPVNFANLTAGVATVSNTLSTLGNLDATGGITTGGADVDLEGGEIFAANIVNEIIAGDDIVITGTPSSPIISADVNVPSLGSRVRRINNVSGTVTLAGGAGITVSESGSVITVESASGFGTYLALTDTPSTLVANAVQYASSSAAALTQSVNLTFDGTNLVVGSTTALTPLTVNGDAALAARSTFRFYETDNSNYVGFRASTSLAGDVVWTLPATDGGANQILITDGSGNLSFADLAAFGIVTELDDLSDVTLTSTTTGDILRFNGSQWVNASSGALGLGDNTFLGLSDTYATYTANALVYADAGASALTQSANFVFDGTSFGVGTSSPTEKLHLYDPSSLTLLVESETGDALIDLDASNGVGDYGAITFYKAGVFTNQIYTGSDTDDNLYFYTAANSIFESGNVGIGTTSPSANLHIYDSTSVSLALESTGGDALLDLNASNGVGDYGAITFYKSGTFTNQIYTGSDTDDNLYIDTSSSGTYTIFEGAGVGIGTTTPTLALVVDGDVGIADGQTVRFYDSNSSNYIALRASTTLGSNYTLTLPVNDGTNNQVLVTDGTGILRFADVSAVGGGVSYWTDLNDTPGVMVDGAIPYAASTTAIEMSSTFGFDGANLYVGASSANARLTVQGSVFFGGGPSNPGLVYNSSAETVSIGTSSTAAKLYVEGGSILQKSGTAASPYLPTLAGSINLAAGANGLQIVGSLAFITTESAAAALTIVDVTDKSSPSIVDTVPLAAAATDVFVLGKYAYVTSNVTGNDFHIIDISNPATAVEVGSLNLTTSALAVKVRGRYAYVTTANAAGNDFFVIDVYDPTSPQIVSSFDLRADGNDLDLKGDYAFVVTDTPNSIRAIDISNPASVTNVGTTTFTGDGAAVEVRGNYAYVGTSGTGDDFHIVNISNPTSMTVVGSMPLISGVNDISIAGSYAYAGTAGSGDDFHIIDISDLTDPVEIGSTEMATGAIFGIKTIGRYAYMTSAASSDDLDIYDVTGVEAQTVLAHSIESGNLAVLGDIVAASNLDVVGGISSGQLGIQTDGVLFVRSSGASVFSGNVGIGTSSPASKLDVYGDFRVGTSGTPALIIDVSTGRVGIGTTSPESALNIYGDSNPTGIDIDEVAQLVIKGQTYTPYSLAVGFDTTDGYGFIQAAEDDTDWSPLALNPYGGSVGIGSTSPTHALTVAGNIAPDANLTYDLGASNLRWNELWTGTANIGTSTWSITTAGADRFGIYDAASGGGNEYFSITQAGNVGIGDTSPSALLNVGAGNANAVDGTDDLYVTDGIELDGDLWGAGDIDIAGHMALGNNVGVHSDIPLRIVETQTADANNYGTYSDTRVTQTATAVRTNYGAYIIGQADAIDENGFNVDFRGVHSEVQINGTSTLNDAFAGYFLVDQNSTGLIDGATPLYTQVSTDVGTTVTTAKGLNIDLSNLGTITTNYGIFIADVVEGTQTNAYALWANEGDFILDGDGDGVAGGTNDGSDLFFGEGQDAAIWYDGTNLNINPQIVGSGSTDFVGSGQFTNAGAVQLMLEDTSDAADVDLRLRRGSTDFYLWHDANGLNLGDNKGEGGETTAMTISTSGNIGIGETAPQSILQIVNNVATGALDNFNEYQLLLYEAASAVTSYGLGVRSNTFVFNSPDVFDFDVDGATMMWIDGGGMGITNPAGTTVLEIVGPAGGDNSILRFVENTTERATFHYSATNNRTVIQAYNSGVVDRVRMPDGSNAIDGDGNFNSTAFGPSEWVIGVANPGDVVCMIGSEIDADGKRRAVVEPCREANSKDVTGVVLPEDYEANYGNPGFEYQDQIIREKGVSASEFKSIWKENHVSVELTGWRPVNAIGPIAVGDSLVSSNVPGHVVATTTPGINAIVGTAAEALGDGETGQVLARIHLRSGAPSAVYKFAQLIDLNATSSELLLLIEDKDTILSRLVKLAQGFVDGVLRVAGIKTDELCIGEVCVDEATLQALIEGSNLETNNDVAADDSGNGSSQVDDTDSEETPETDTNPDPTSTTTENATSTISPATETDSPTGTTTPSIDIETETDTPANEEVETPEEETESDEVLAPEDSTQGADSDEEEEETDVSSEEDDSQFPEPETVPEESLN